jgi:hypothetical protein
MVEEALLERVEERPMAVEALEVLVEMQTHILVVVLLIPDMLALLQYQE